MPDSLPIPFATSQEFLATMLQAAPNVNVVENGKTLHPLAHFNTSAKDDFARALLSAWAEIGGVYEFYQERIALEGYWTTATEDDSIQLLAALIGYAPFPGAAARTNLAFAVGTQARSVTIPQGAQTAVMNVPPSGQAPIVFETDEPVLALPEHNSIAPYVSIKPRVQRIFWGMGLLLVNGVTTGIQAGDGILFAPGGLARVDFAWLEIVETVTVDRRKKLTRLTLKACEETSKGEPWPERGSVVYVYRRASMIFGNNAPDWSSLPAATKAKYSSRTGGISAFNAAAEVYSPISLNANLPDVEIRAVVVDSPGAIYLGTSSGVYRRKAAATAWEQCNTGLSQQNIFSLSVNASGNLHAGGLRGQIFRSRDGGESWESIGIALSVVTPEVLLTFSLLGPFQWFNRFIKIRPPQIPVTAGTAQQRVDTVVRALVAVDNFHFLFAGTDDGLYQLNEVTQEWMAVLLPGQTVPPQVDTLALYGHSNLFVGTSLGAFKCDLNDSKLNWKPVEFTGDSKIRVAQFVFFQGAGLLGVAATDHGVFLGGSTDPWNSIGSNPTTAISSVAVVDLGYGAYRIVAADASAIYTWENKDATGFKALPANSNSPPLLAAFSPGQCLVAEAFAMKNESDWPGLKLTPGELDLVPALSITTIQSLGGTAVTLRQTTPTAMTITLPVTAASSLARTAFGTSATVSRLKTGDGGCGRCGLECHHKFEIRQTMVFAQPEELSLYIAEEQRFHPIRGKRVALGGSFPALKKGQKISFSGRRASSVVWAAFARRTLFRAPIACGEELDSLWISPTLQAVFKANGIVLSPNATVFLSRKAARWVVRDGDIIYLAIQEADALDIFASELFEVIRYVSTGWTLKDLRGQILLLPAVGSAVDWAPAASTNPLVGEVATITKAVAGETVTRCVLAGSLANAFDPAQTAICANVAAASHGETVTGEILGNGDGAHPSQQFALQQPPLTYLEFPEDGSLRSTLEIRINGGRTANPRLDPGKLDVRLLGIRWREVAALFGADPSDPVYMVRPGNSGGTSVVFGDGIHGARLPSGNENVAATYRHGIGAAGNLGANQLILRKKVVPGVTAVTNPIAATGGLDPETLDSARRRGPSSTRCLERIVTLEDYEDFARNFPGVSLAVATLAGAEISVRIAATNGASIENFPDLAPSLTKALAERRLDELPLRVLGLLLARFAVCLLVELSAGARAAEVEKCVRKELANTFSGPGRKLGEGISIAEILACVHRVEGVAGVKIESLGREGLPHGQLEFAPEVPAGADELMTLGSCEIRIRP